ncbi:glycosyl transferase family 90-domain-containing protein [Aspergillus coremiiformis]|uniref:Glycosyl transferase family 90-domain-containing protein n=1 Tax=Aspergillus coremiiformis TaxID=138285 RepID=A0A5N6ZBH5_9EURO|nr:glycosyl transferase family 90-domain-containing protein [Aspergillus coremiiformis]
MTLPSCSRWRRRPGSLLYLLYFVGFLICVCIIAIWYGVNSDRDYIHPLLTQLIPAGHCACQTSTTFQCSSCLTCSEQSLAPQPSPTPKWEFTSDRDANNQGLSRVQCKAAFPGLYEDIVRAETFWRSQGALVTEDLDRVPVEFGMVRAFISRGELSVVAARARQEDHRRKIVAALSSIHRALVADSDRASRRDIEFIFSVEDKVEDVTNAGHPVWVLARSAEEQGVWLMPDFGFWAWDSPLNSLGPFDQVVERVKRADIPWAEKTPQLVWRGKPSFAPKLRRALMDAARDKPWGDVKQVDWLERTNIMSMEDHCRYMFIAHVEGRSYSASLKYRQACNSVIVAHKLQYIQHHHYLLVPDGPHQNYIEVERDFSDLSRKIEPLLNDPATGQRIANNSVRTFRERYLTKAAEACYWRQLFDRYGNVWNSSVPIWSDVSQRERGLRYESFILMDSQTMFDFRATDSIT